MEEKLEKLKIENLDLKTDNVFYVQFNPTEYSIDDASRWTDQDKKGQKPELQYSGGARKKLTMELFFDTYESRSDVRDHTSKIAGLLVFNKDKHRPPKVKLSWGKDAPGGPHADFPFVCVLESLKQQFVLFLGDGTPCRAKLSVSFVEFTLSEDELKKNEPKSPDHTKIYIIKVGDTLSSIASLFFNDPMKWRFIAVENDIDNPRVLTPGNILSIPKIT